MKLLKKTIAVWSILAVLFLSQCPMLVSGQSWEQLGNEKVAYSLKSENELAFS